jgi:hypothetical protein
MFGLNGIGTPEAPHSAIAKSVQRLNVKVIANHGEIAMPTISAHTYKLSIQVPESWLIPSAPRTSASAMDVTWSLNSDVIAAIRTPPRPNKGLISTKFPLFSMGYGGKSALHRFGVDPSGSQSSPGKTGSLAHANRPAGGADRTSMAPVLATAAAVIILALPLSCEAVSGPKSLNRMPAVPATATNAATSTGAFLCAYI